MKLLSALVLAFVISAPCVAAAQSPPVASRVRPQAFTLANGLRLYVQSVPDESDVYVSGTIEVSPAFDPPGKTGTGAFAAALLHAGRTTDDALTYGTTFGAHGPAADLDRILEALAAAETSRKFASWAIVQERTRRHRAVARRDADPGARAQIAFDRALYSPNDPVVRFETGATIDAIRYDDLVAYASRYFRPDRTTLVVVGNVEPEAVRVAVGRRFGDWTNAGSPPATQLPPIPPLRSTVIVLPARSAEVSVRLGRPAVGRLDPDFYAFNLLNAVLDVRGLPSALLVTRERGFLAIDLHAAPPDVRAAVAAAKAAVRALAAAPVVAADWDAARTRLLAAAGLGSESTATILARCQNIADNRLPVDYFITLPARYARVTPAEGWRVARRYLRPDGDIEVYLGPFGESKRQ